MSTRFFYAKFSSNSLNINGDEEHFEQKLKGQQKPKFISSTSLYLILRFKTQLSTTATSRIHMLGVQYSTLSIFLFVYFNTRIQSLPKKRLSSINTMFTTSNPPVLLCKMPITPNRTHLLHGRIHCYSY